MHVSINAYNILYVHVFTITEDQCLQCKLCIAPVLFNSVDI